MSRIIRAFLVDDEQPALDVLDIFLNRLGGVDVCGAAVDPYEAFDRIVRLQPDVVFLDIEMLDMNGVELAERIKGAIEHIHIVFVTAYDQYAVSAFEQAALDYILKPLEIQRLEKTMQRLRNELRTPPFPALPGAGPNEGTNNKGTSDEGANNERANGEETNDPAFGRERLTVRAFGGFDVKTHRSETIKWRTAKEKELFAYLLLHDDAPVHRDQLLDALWQDDDLDKSRVYLHTCVSYLRKNFRQHGFERLVRYEAEAYALDMERIGADVMAFRQQYDPARLDDAVLLEQLSRLYQGPLLMNHDYVWASEWVAYYEHAAEAVRRKLMLSHAERGDSDSAVRSARDVLRINPYSEEAYRVIIMSYLQSGRRDEAVRAYRSLTEALHELQLQPPEHIRRLFR